LFVVIQVLVQVRYYFEFCWRIWRLEEKDWGHLHH
jgi:hypothetical protein